MAAGPRGRYAHPATYQPAPGAVAAGLRRNGEVKTAGGDTVWRGALGYDVCRCILLKFIRSFRQKIARNDGRGFAPAQALHSYSSCRPGLVRGEDDERC